MTEQDSVKAMSILNEEEEVFESGLPRGSIAGMIDGADPSPDIFVPNPESREVMHRVTAEAGPRDPELQRAARDPRNGSLHVID